MSLLLLKITIVPLLTTLTAYIQRKWSHQIGGAIAGLPLVVGPILVFLAIEQDMVYVRGFASSALAGYVNISAFIFTFVYLSDRFSWWSCLAASFLASLAAIVIVFNLHLSDILSTAAAWFSLAVNIFFVTRFPYNPNQIQQSLKHPILIQGTTALVIVLAITGISRSVGSHYIGLFAALPIMWVVLFGFTHAHGGRMAIIAFVRGAMMSNIGYLSFLTVLSFAQINAPIILFVTAFATAFITAYLANRITRQWGVLP